MKEPIYIPEDPENELWDVIIIGTGMGGATVGYELSRRGNRVLFIEKGKFFPDTAFNNVSTNQNDSEVRLLKGRWPHKIKAVTSFGSVKFWGPSGCGTGGSTILYGAQLERFHPADFSPRQYFQSPGGSSIPEHWPINYKEILPYYRKAEAHLQVCGTQDMLNPDSEAPLLNPPLLSERDAFIYNSMKEAELHPYRSHVGYFNKENCWECVDLCLKGCKSDAGTRSFLPAVYQHGAKVLTECEVTHLAANKTTVQAVHAIKDKKELILRSKIVVLAAGAYITPVILLRSTSINWPNGLANGSGMVGRNLMLHTSDFVMLNPKKDLDSLGPVKSITLNDFYIHNGIKLGTFQSVGLKPLSPIILSYLRYIEDKSPHWFRKKISTWLPKLANLAAKRFQKSSVFVTIVEDLPYLHNRIELDSDSADGFRLHYLYSKELRKRNRQLLNLISRRLSPYLSTTIVTGTKNNINFGHACGTCRFGNDPKSSVLNADNKAHELDNLYIVDASFFPTSSGTNPSLTIAANAIRVGEIIDQKLNSKKL
jgi:choline dehydrogenase-like flavoprotein